MNALEKFKIAHLSSTSLSLWRENPGLWSLRYLYNVKDAGNAKMWRGTAVENGLATFLRSKDLDLAILAALQNFDMNSQGESNDENDGQRDLIAPMLELCAQHWQPPSPLSATQIKIEHWFEGVPVPIIGYLDFAFEDTDVDLKTTERMPSTPTPAHVRQVSLYRAARGRRGGLLYVTNKKYAYFDVDDDMMERALGDLECCARSLVAFLSRVNSPKEAISCLPMNDDDYRWPKKDKRPIPVDLLLAG